MQCANCGENNPETYKFCGTCGALLEDEPTPESYPADAPASFHGYYRMSERDTRFSSRRTRLILLGVVAAGLVVFGCAVCLIGGAIVSWSTFSSVAPRAQEPLPADAPDIIETPSVAVPSDGPAASTPQAQNSSLHAAPTLQRSAVRPSPTLPNVTLAPPLSTGFQKWGTAHALAVFKAAGLSADNPRLMTAEDYGQVPRVATEAIRFFLPALGGNKGGRVYSFATSANLETVRKYYISAKGIAVPPWIFVRDNILVQINGELPSEQAVRYLAALNLLR